MKGSRKDWEDETRRDTPGYTDVDQSALSQEMVEGMRETARLPAVIEIRDRTASYLDAPTGGDVLDVGCGLADVLISLAVSRPDLSCVGVDRSRKMLEVAEQDALAAGVKVRFEPASALELPFEDSIFDLVRTERMLQWVDPPQDAFREIVRVAKPGGTILALDTDWRTMAMNLGDERLEKLVSEAFASEFKASAGGRLRAWALAAGLEVLDLISVCSTSTGWDPDSEPGPLGLPPPFAIGKIVRDVLGASQADASSLEEAMIRAGRDGSFQFSVSMYALAALKP